MEIPSRTSGRMLVSPERNQSSSWAQPAKPDPLRRNQGEPPAQIEPHLIAEDAARARARAVFPPDTVRSNQAEKIEVRLHALNVERFTLNVSRRTPDCKRETWKEPTTAGAKRATRPDRRICTSGEKRNGAASPRNARRGSTGFLDRPPRRPSLSTSSAFHGRRRRTMDPNLHQKMGINHLNRVLNYAPFVAEQGRATVHLTVEDWHVVADTLFRMHTPPRVAPGGHRKLPAEEREPDDRAEDARLRDRRRNDVTGPVGHGPSVGGRAQVETGNGNPEAARRWPAP
ncbi:MAG: hypothetical protein KatS3mg044_0993 [Rhodothermaceae bacterium]|nr:MAG: hypothetical protein KatS3mg044_0993 [Rhodothermaceae bacterium]